MIDLLIGPAIAATDPPAKLLQRGQALFLRGYFAQSIEVLKQASQSTDPAIQGEALLLIGLNHHGQAQVEQAQRYFRLAAIANPLQRLDPQRYNPEVVRLFKRARDALRGRIAFIGGKGATLSVDGARARPLPPQIDLPIGYRNLLVRHRGAILYEQRILVRHGSQLRVRLTTPKTTRPALKIDSQRSPPPAGSFRRIALWTSGAIAVASAATAIGFGAAALADRSRANDIAAGPVITPAQRAEHASLADSVDDRSTVATVSWVVFGVSAALCVGSYLWELLSQNPRPNHRQPPADGTLAGISF